MKACLCLLVLALSLCAADRVKTETIHGKLVVRSGEAPVLEAADHKRIALDGDANTRKVLQDPRVNSLDAQATGHFTAPGKFLIDPQHTHPLLVHDHDKLKMITYWCEVCSVRAYTPGPCVCCQGDTGLELRELDQIR